MFNADVIQNIITGAGVVGLGLWGAYERWWKSKADRANTEAGVAVAMGQEAVFNMLTQRLDMMEKEIQVLRDELAEERAHSRKLELHIWKLENVMRNANIDPPVFEDREPYSTKSRSRKAPSS